MYIEIPLIKQQQDKELNFQSMEGPQPFVHKERLKNIRTGNRLEKPKAELRTENISYLENCWREQIGLPINEATSVTISNFYNVNFLRGYQKIVTTDQGQYFKLLKRDIDFSVLTQNAPKYGNRGRLKTWSKKGVHVFLVEKPINFSNPLPHRFAVKLNRKGTCNWLEVGSYYCHTYQTKVNVEGEYKVLQSRVMASKLKEMFGERYHPRRNEFSRGIARSSFPTHGLPTERDHLSNSGVNRPWQPTSTSQIPMNWVPVAQLPNVNPLAPQSIQLQRHVPTTNLNRADQEKQQEPVRQPFSYKQAFTNQQVPPQQQTHLSHFLPSYQYPVPINNEQFYR